MLTIGIIGTGWIVDQFVDAIKLTNRLRLGTVYSRDINKAKAKQDAWGFAKSADNFEDFLASGDDIIYIATPNGLHFTQVKLCLDANKHVICEKPLALNPAEFEELYTLADGKNRYLFEAYRHINSPHYAILKDSLPLLGTLRLVHLSFSKYSSQYDAYKKGDNPNVFNPDYAGGALYDLGVYPIALAVGLFGKWKSLSYKAVYLKNGVDATGMMILEYEGFLCHISFSKTCTSLSQSEILGEKGEIIIPKVSTLNNIIIKGEVQNLMPVKNDMYYEVMNFLDIIQNNDTSQYNKLRNISNLTSYTLDQARIRQS